MTEGVLGSFPEVRAAIDRYVGAEGGIVRDDVRDECLPTILAALGAQEVQLLEIVLYLDKPLKDTTNPQPRRLAVRLLSDCLGGPTGEAPAKLNFKHVDTFANFFCDKLHDWQCVEGATVGLMALLRNYGPVLRTLKASGRLAKAFEGVDSEEGVPVVAGIARAIFREVHLPSHTQTIRKNVLDVVSMLLEDWHDEVAFLVGQESLGEGVNGVIEEERDPRNLLLAFTVATRLLKDFPPACVPDSALVALFETLTSYFPITFTPPKDDKFGITGEDLRIALSRAVGASQRMAEHAVPFFLDQSMDINSADATTTVEQALSMLGDCLESYGPEIAKENLANVIKTSRDQVCNTATPCPQEFANCFKRALATAMRGTPAGLHPHWLARSVDPALKEIAAEAAAGLGKSGSLKCSGSRRLLLGAAGAHTVLLERCWTLVIPALLAQDPNGCMPEDAIAFVLDLVKLAEPPLPRSTQRLAPRHFKNVLGAALKTALALRPGGDLFEDEKIPIIVFELLGRLCRLAGEEESLDAFKAMSLALTSGPMEVDATTASWCAAWRGHLTSSSADAPTVVALATAVREVAAAHPARASELAPVLISSADGVIKRNVASDDATWLLVVLPRLLAATAFCLAKGATTELDASAQAASAAEGLFTRVVALSRLSAAIDGHSDVATATAGALDALAEVLEMPAALGPHLQWCATQIAAALELPQGMAHLVDGAPGTVGSTGGHGAGERRAVSAKRLLRSLLAQLPPKEAATLRLKVLESVASVVTNKNEELAPLITLLPAVLPEAAQEHQTMCLATLPTLRLCAASPQHEALEPAALEAIGALVEAAPTPDATHAILSDLRGAFGELLRPTTASPAASVIAARSAARCWAAAAAALLRRGGLAAQAANFLEDLLGALERDGPITPFVPLAFLVLTPPQFVAADANSPCELPQLPPLALQQLSRTVLPSLLTRSKASSGVAGRAALESACVLLCALPPAVACQDCSDELRWCTLTGLRRVAQDSSTEVSRDGAGAAETFAVQVLQLLLRACRRSVAWVEDDLHSIVPHVAMLAAAHRVPLARLASLQVMFQLVNQSHGHLVQPPFKRAIEAALRRAVGDAKREVRLAAVACLNAWHCGPDDD